MNETIERVIAIIIFSLLGVVVLPFALVGLKNSFIYESAGVIGENLEIFCKYWLAAWREVLPKKKKQDSATLPESAKQALLDSFMKGADE